MKKKNLKVIVELTLDGFHAYVPELPGCISFGTNLDELKINIKEAIDLHIKGMLEDEEQIPFNFEDGYVLELRLDVAQVFQVFKSLNSTGFSERIGMNRSLLNQYVRGVKHPSEKQSKRILQGVVDLGKELSSISV